MLRLKVALAASAAVVVAAAAMAAVQLGDGGRSSIRRRLMATEMGEWLAGWLTPPYLHVLVNAIILSIAASGLFWWPPSDPAADFGTEHARRQAVEWSGEMKEVAWAGEDADSVEAERLSESTELPTGWPPEELSIAVPFGHRRNGESDSNIYKAARRKIRKPRPPPADSLESTWLAITEGRRGSRRNDLKKLDTWSEPTAPDEDNVEAATSEMISPPAAARLRRDPWPEQEELNRRVEAFIDKFNDEMRLQRQQSMQQFVDMINRGSR
ncbi:uncharacterized protein LOC141823700 [Curcuma longa]|uniref:uncharacterized protein LOC141823700 n=1 Tax=Curcuma longa TaxID=136217 RepID=UPI003D9E34F2